MEEKNQRTKHKQSEQPVAASYRRKRRLQTLKHTASYSFQKNSHASTSRGGSATDDAVVQRRKLKIAASNPSSQVRVHPFNRQAPMEQRDQLGTPPPT
ncbi:hypothetical protein IGI04_014018 [Brassica rapa subsp. trilocularis]|uniref:Uncharacterized protein n=1 Tax=Brassica rapa subsp. trilocularis TaxID=1813537 RepID=A0ABQ7NAI6_BRACM|nr:hypothetical protein IGI04_014018 [Brassica rapa subsp. trilocularis]